MLAMHLRGATRSPPRRRPATSPTTRPLTVRDSSLSACTQAVLAAEVGHLDLAYDYLAEAALMDLDDLEHNTRDGLHIAVAGRDLDRAGGRIRRPARPRRHVSFTPRLPQAVTGWCSRSHPPGPAAPGRGDPRARPRTTVADGQPLEILHYGEEVRLSARARRSVRPIEADTGTGRSPASRRGGNPLARRRTTEDGG